METVATAADDKEPSNEFFRPDVRYQYSFSSHKRLRRGGDVRACTISGNALYLWNSVRQIFGYREKCSSREFPEPGMGGHGFHGFHRLECRRHDAAKPGVTEPAERATEPRVAIGKRNESRRDDTAGGEAFA